MRIRDFPIRRSLTLLTLFSSGLAVLLASIAFTAYERKSLQVSAESELSALAGSLGANTAASLAFNDQKTANEMLRSLATEPHVHAAFLYDQYGHLFVEYQRPGAALVATPALHKDGAVFTGKYLILFRGVRLDQERIGSIALVFDRSEFNSRLVEYGEISILVLSLSVMVTFLASIQIARSIGGPLIQLADVARRVTADNDYSARARIAAGGESGLLVESFNKMLSQIESREAALQSALNSLRESEERYALAARGANDGLWDWNLISNQIYFSSRWNHMLGYSEHEQWTAPEEWFKRIHPADRERVQSDITSHFEGRTAEFASEYRMLHKSGGYIWTLSRGIAVRDETGKAIRIAGSQSDITEGKTADPLTQIPNRLYFLDRLESAIDSARRANTVLAVLFIDLDGFKVVNDSLGHAAGDELLVAVAGRLRACVRSNLHQRSRGQAVVARIGGDEFAVLLSQVEHEGDAGIVAERILERLKEPIYFEGRRMFVSASIGIAFNSHDSTPEDLLRDADTAMYSAKSAGKARVETFNQGMRERVITRFETEAGLRKAIESDQLVLHYQPIKALRDHRIYGFEALVRWNHPERGLILPGEFIPLAEESDLIIPLGRWVLREACRQMATWRRSSTSERDLTIHVNVSSRQLADPHLVDDVKQILSQTGLDPRALALEVTESSIMGNDAQTLETLHRLKETGITLEIDDFGTGYSSLSYLQRLPFDTLKIDRSFIRELEAGSESVDIVKAILELARSLKMDVVAEGVETIDQFATLEDMGATFVQGYLISRPVGAADAWCIYMEKTNRELLALAPHTQPLQSSSRRTLYYMK